MKPVYLEFCGVNSFSEKTEIDFRSLLAGGVFGIFGDTGSGKSTILDCIHLALYGVIERSAGSMNDCINYNSDSAYVVFDFEITTEGVRHIYRVRRERKRKNGATKAFLYEYGANGGLDALAEGTRDVNEALEKIIGLTFSDFKMCIALPQGDFAALVKAATAERVKLVSRLFDLERYGERLSKTVNEKYYKAEEEVNLLKAKMGQNEEGTEENIRQKLAETEGEKQKLSVASSLLKEAEIAYEKAVALEKEKKLYDENVRLLKQFQEKLPEMEARRQKAEKLPLAKSVLREWEEVEKNRKEKEDAKKAALRAEEEQKQAQSALEQAKQSLSEGDFDDRILKVSLDLERVRTAKADLDAAEEAERRLKQCVADFSALKKQCPWEDFEEQRRKLEEEMAALGEDDTLLAYLKRHCKDVFLSDAYGEFRLDLKKLGESYPIVREETERLMEKYKLTTENGDAVFDIAKINIQFKQIEQSRKVLKLRLEELEKRKREYDANETKKNLLIEQGKIYRQSYEAAKAKVEFIKDTGSAEALEKSLKCLQQEKAAAQKNVEAATEKVNFFLTETEKQKGIFVLRESMEQNLAKTLERVIKESGFLSVEEAKTLLRELGDEETLLTECKTFFERYELYRHKCEETDTSCFADYDEEDVSKAKEARIAAQEEKDACTRRIAACEAELARLSGLREKYLAFENELVGKEKKKALCDELRTLLKSNRILEFIASEYLQDICTQASKTLLALTNGKYFLRYDKEFKVGDNLDGGNLRAVKTLSGGETYLVSLSLALSLSGAICQKSLRPIEFFFLDEGFGTLDGKLVDTVMDVLGKLSKTFAVGLISHVEELKHRISNKILVTGATESRGSIARAEHF